MEKGISEKQQMILEFVQRKIEEDGYPPTVREICKAVNLSSTSTVHAHIKKLQEKGYIQKNSLKPRALKVLVGNNEKNKDKGYYTSK